MTNAKESQVMDQQRVPKKVEEHRAAVRRQYLEEARQSGSEDEVQNAVEALGRAGYGTDGK